eukprot:Hpha_TRINITY_DN15900_c0_g12::TRINITY_DN15900_c0_g12_i1::g.73741::m.73741
MVRRHDLTAENFRGAGEGDVIFSPKADECRTEPLACKRGPLPPPGPCPSSCLRAARFHPSELPPLVPDDNAGRCITPRSSALKPAIRASPPQRSPKPKYFRTRFDDQRISPVSEFGSVHFSVISSRCGTQSSIISDSDSVSTVERLESPATVAMAGPNVDGTDRHTGAQVLQYATDILGMNLDGNDRRLLHIAREGVEASLPPEWHWARSASTGDVYYIHAPSRKTQWDHPADEHYRRVLKRKRKHLTCVLRALAKLDARGWAVHIPGYRDAPPLSAQALLSPSTKLQRQQSTSETEGITEDIHLDELPPGMFSRLTECSTTPTRPNVIDLGTVATGYLSLHSWLHMKWDGSSFTILLREHAFLSNVDKSSSLRSREGTVSEISPERKRPMCP